MGFGNGIIPAIRLHNGTEIPQLGLGVWQAREGEEVEHAVTSALDAGYRLIDTASIYGNERGVGRAIAASGISREELFITSKLWNDKHNYTDALQAYQDSLDRLGLDYLDLYLIHWPAPKTGNFLEGWKALETLYTEGRVRNIGVSNFKVHHLETLLAHSTQVPVINQIELHPRLQQLETRHFCEQHNIVVESYSPLMQGGELLNDPAIVQIAAMYKKTPAQIILRWHIQSGLVAIPKSVTPERICENIDIGDFELSPEDMEIIRDMDQHIRIGADPDTADF